MLSNVGPKKELYFFEITSLFFRNPSVGCSDNNGLVAVFEGYRRHLWRVPVCQVLRLRTRHVQAMTQHNKKSRKAPTGICWHFEFCMGRFFLFPICMFTVSIPRSFFLVCLDIVVGFLAMLFADFGGGLKFFACKKNCAGGAAFLKEWGVGLHTRFPHHHTIAWRP